MPDTILIDRVPVLKVFTLMLEGGGMRVLRITGTEKMGKSRLLREFRKLSTRDWSGCCALIDLRSKFQSYSDIVFQITQQIPELEFNHFLESWQKIQSEPRVEIKKTNLLMSALSINMPTQKKNFDEFHRNIVTSKFCQDLLSAGLANPLVLLFDTLEAASPDIQNWLNEQFIVSVLQIPNVFLVLTGRSLPELPSNWQDVCESITLLPVGLDDHIAFCESLGISASKDIIQAFHQAFDGTPGLFAEYAPKMNKID